jgi:hypothetical protein
MRAVVIVLVAFASLSCVATTFTGNPKVPHGAAGCKSICSSYGMELTGMVALGEYSDGCICEIPGKRASVGAAGTGAATVAVMADIERRKRESDLVAPPPNTPP